MEADLQPMAVPPASLEAHVPVAGREAVSAATEAAVPLEGVRVLHVSGARPGGPVPELLSALLPLAADVGVRVEWRVLFGDADLQRVAESLQDGLLGAELALPDEHWRAYLEACERAAGALDGADVLVLHDAAPLGLAPASGAPAVWLCHPDASRPDPPALERARPLVEACARVAAPAASFVPPALGGERVVEAPPGIDPLSTRNLEPAPRLAGRVVRPLGVDLERPFACQVMRLDRWGDPHAAIEAFDAAREEVPELQLVIAMALEAADPAEWRAAKEVADYAADRDGLHLLTSYEGVGDLELGALQRLARVGLQMSLHDDFGLTAVEALWKGTPVVSTGARAVRDGVDGYLVDSPERAAARVVELVRDPGLAVELGRAGRERVRERFLVTHALEEELRLLADTVGA